MTLLPINEPLIAISLWQPWASLLVNGAKIHETRGWLTKHRGPLIVHAAKRSIPADVGLGVEAVCRRIWGQAWRAGMPSGALIGIVDIVNCIPAERVYPGGALTFTEMDNEACGDFSAGRFAWRAENPRALPKPIPFKGRQGFFRVPADVLKEAA